MENETEIYDCIIVGGGIAGLTAAEKLSKNNLSVLLLESSDRFGGRTLTVKNELGSWDLGGQWICRETQTRIAALVDDLGLKLVPQFNDGRKILEDEDGKIGTYQSAIPSLPVVSLLDFLFNVQFPMDKLAQKIPLENPLAYKESRKFDAMSVETWKQNHAWTAGSKMLVDILLRIVFGAEPSDLSLLYALFYLHSGGGTNSLAEVKGGAQQDKVEGGTNQISDKLADRIRAKGQKILVEHPVISVDQPAEGGVVISCKNGRQFRAKYAIFAIPPTQLQKLDFSPPLPVAKAQLYQRAFMGSFIKIVIVYKTYFWREKGFSGETLSANSDVLNNPITFSFDATNYPAIVSFITGKAGVVWSDKPFEERKKAILNHLAKYFGPEALNPVDYLEKDWNKDEWTRGCPVNHFPTGAWEKYHKALRTPFLNVHFAGTETATVWNGYMDGAVQSAERAVQEIMDRMKGLEIKEQLEDPEDSKLPKNSGVSPFIPPLFVLALSLILGWWFMK